MDSTIRNKDKEGPKKVEDPNKNCPLHKKCPLRKCREFREKPLEQRKAFLKENSMCFRCCSSVSHQAKDCKAMIQCSECEMDRHIAALHKDLAPWEVNNVSRSPNTSWRGGRTGFCDLSCNNYIHRGLWQHFFREILLLRKNFDCKGPVRQ